MSAAELAPFVRTGGLGNAVAGLAGALARLGHDVTVTVLGVKGNQVRIGVNATRDVAVHREEIYERIKREQAEQAAQEQAGSD